MKKRLLTLFLAFNMLTGITGISINTVYANEIIAQEDDRGVMASQIFSIYDTSISSVGNGTVYSVSKLTTLNTTSKSIKAEIQELSNSGIWVTVATYSDSQSSSGTLTISKTHNGVKGKKYRTTVTYYAYANTGNETRTGTTDSVTAD